ncbi:hypothetical protein TcWFU_000628 [Taenia crassiceps]|uniref:Uncharacterized protein n=1 Tax=Taenia crassiceps TaxID=6207 RepID=A0ABR4Q025_9CEST
MQHSFAPHGALLSSSFSPHLHYSILPPLPHRTLRSHSASTLTPAHPPHASNLRSQSASAKNENSSICVSISSALYTGLHGVYHKHCCEFRLSSPN